MRYLNVGFTMHPPLTVLWNQKDKSDSITLSGGLLTATGGASGDTGVRATLLRSAGKYYYEINCTVTNNADTGPGIANASANLGQIGNTVLGAMILFRNGNTYKNGSLLYNAGPIITGILRVAYDASNHLVWFSNQGGNWNNNAANDPGTGVGGQDVSGFDSGGLFPCWSCGTTGDTCIANFGATTFSYAVPNLFKAWNTG